MAAEPSNCRWATPKEQAAAKHLRYLLAPYYVVLGLIKFFRQGY